MSPITHFLAGWSTLERTQTSDRDRALVVWIGLAPDLDGLGIVADFATRALGWPETNYYQTLHRAYGHGLPAALVFSALVALLADSKLRAGLGAFASIHLHFLCDLLGSRGAGAEDIWPISYLSPFSDRWLWEWSGQWPLVGWQNMALTAALLLAAAAQALKTGYSPLRIVSKAADQPFMSALRARAAALRGRRPD